MRLLAIAWFVFVATVYCPDLGRGFIKDDFTWIRSAQAATSHPISLIRQADAGFYRPLVTVVFAFDYAVHGWNARGYGWTNLALYILCTGGVVALALAVGLSPRAAVLAAFLWAVNPHGINMAILWLSGRTALLLTLFSLLAAVAFLRERYIAAAVFTASALLAKEEAVALPFIFLAWTWIRRGERPRWPAVASVCLPLAVYAIVRSATPAMTPATAPSFYRFTFEPLQVIRNAGEYLDRSATLTAAAVVIAMIVTGARPLTASQRQPIAMLAIWWAGMLAITIWLPVRSSLYAVCPSIAPAMAGAMLIDAMWSASTRSWLWREPLFAALLLAAIPIYQIRGDTRAEAARVSQRALNAIATDLAALPRSGTVVLHEDPDVHVFREAFGDLTAEALRTRFAREWDARIEDSLSPSPATGGRGGVIAEYWIRHGTITRAPSP